jgi:hypothetical protein
VVETDLMPSLVGGTTETVCGKLKISKGKPKPNFELEPTIIVHAAVSILFNLGRHLVRAEHYRDPGENPFEEWGSVM